MRFLAERLSALRRCALPCLGDNEAFSGRESLGSGPGNVGEGRSGLRHTECCRKRNRLEGCEICQAFDHGFDVGELMDVLAGIRQHRAEVVILDITGVPIVDSGVAAYLNKTIQAAQLKGARTIVTGISEAVAEAIVDLGIDWGGIETLADLRTGLLVALNSLGVKLTR